MSMLCTFGILVLSSELLLGGDDARPFLLGHRSDGLLLAADMHELDIAQGSAA